MVEATLVDEIWREVSALRKLIETADSRPLTEALFIDPVGSWRLVAVYADIESAGVRPIYRTLDDAAKKEQVDVGLLSQLVLLDPSDQEAQILAASSTISQDPPRRFEVEIRSLPGYVGAVISRDLVSERRATGQQLEQSVADALAQRSLSFEQQRRLSIGWRPDFVVSTAAGDFLIEAVVTGRKSLKSRLRDAAGLANVAERPVIMVAIIMDGFDLELKRSYGSVPLLIVDWDSVDSALELDNAIKEAERWLKHTTALAPL
jgi:hypothetical protein